MRDTDYTGGHLWLSTEDERYALYIAHSMHLVFRKDGVLFSRIYRNELSLSLRILSKVAWR